VGTLLLRENVRFLRELGSRVCNGGHAPRSYGGLGFSYLLVYWCHISEIIYLV
jgi:hypothetical protein